VRDSDVYVHEGGLAVSCCSTRLLAVSRRGDATLEVWVRPGVHGISANPAKKFVATGPSVLTQFLVNLQSHSLKYPGSHFHHIE